MLHASFTVPITHFWSDWCFQEGSLTFGFSLVLTESGNSTISNCFANSFSLKELYENVILWLRLLQVFFPLLSSLLSRYRAVEIFKILFQKKIYSCCRNKTANYLMVKHKLLYFNLSSASHLQSFLPFLPWFTFNHMFVLPLLFHFTGVQSIF